MLGCLLFNIKDITSAQEHQRIYEVIHVPMMMSYSEGDSSEEFYFGVVIEKMLFHGKDQNSLYHQSYIMPKKFTKTTTVHVDCVKIVLTKGDGAQVKCQGGLCTRRANCKKTSLTSR